MRIARADVLTYRGAASGARGAVATWVSREGLLLRVVAADGSVGQGEASPLPGYSPDTLDAAQAALRALDWGAMPTYDAGASVVEWLSRLVLTAPGLPPSARFALETALLDLTGQRLRQPLWTLLRSGVEGLPDAAPVPLSALVGGADDERAVQEAAAAVARGIRTVKLKIVGPILGAQVETLARVRNAVGDAAIRLDANGTLDAGTALGELGRLGPIRPELVEEPVALRDIARLRGSPVPVALDESLQPADSWDHLQPLLAGIGCVAVVLKPTALGGLSRCLVLAARARASGLHVTVSHTFDGPIALAAAAHLALAVGSRSCASGLDRHGALAAWPSVDVPHLGPTSVLVAERPGLGLPPLPSPGWAPP